ncbi:protein of unknown function [Taphrina deformans PYCC 5710]|uniref:Aldehyde dehydrogenase domain-containing protein n=1 Tax=Taphrina deformans (strain PYCC 5710 / ATCC 11124 / CBS 356.35 / IMI 108563 / JCM 9778 / NBRC 8474) TaxID=1097556 RepID=R4XL01_TAPDE|nr:protein of unknown function [Taphrina deformans PYCC 5710]|eukprot:CCG85089.1 protein of unknown function [Taphrina deformans PYCC 5710]
MVADSSAQAWIGGAYTTSKDNIEAAISSCYKVQKQWSSTTLEERKLVLRRAAGHLHAAKEKLARSFVEEVGVSHQFAMFNIDTSIGMFDELLNVVDETLKSRKLELSHGDHAIVSRVPFGVVLAIAPWNAAIILSCRALLTPILCGNSCVMKGSEISPQTHLIWGEIFKNAGLPDGVLNIIIVPRAQASEATERLISDDRIRHVNFTGSTAIGRIIGGLCGKHLKPVILELGGKAPVIVAQDANLEAAASHCLLGGWLNQGQICMSTERVFVVASAYDKFTKYLRNLAAKSGLRQSGLSLVNPSATEKYKRLLENAIAAGATLLSGDLSGSVPTILADVTPTMHIYTEESFAHTFYVIKVHDIDEAIEFANSSRYGLSSAVFTEDLASGIIIGNRLEAGATHINVMTVQDEPNVPHGGFKDSGYGRFNSVEGIMSFSQVKVVTVHHSSIAHT